MKLSTFALSAFAAAALAVSAVALPTIAKEMTVEVGGAPMYPSKNIIQNAVNSKDHTTLVAAAKAAGLVDTLQGPGPFTVFAPTNDAFAKLPAGTVDTLLEYTVPEKVESLHLAIRDLHGRGGPRCVYRIAIDTAAASRDSVSPANGRSW